MEDINKKILSNLDKIPDDILLNNIKPILRPETLVWLDKTSYIKHHYCIEHLIKHRPSITYPSGVYDSYVRDIIRLDYSFVFQQLINDKISNWKKINNYRYKDKIYNSYLYFLFDYALDNNSVKCRKIINNIINALYSKNRYKNTKDKSNRWKK